MANDFISISGQDFYHYSIKSDKKKDLWRSLENLKVSHNTFGDGKIVEIDAYINISFSRNLLAETARTLVREAFKKGHIKSILIPKCHAFYEDLKNVKEERIRQEIREEEERIIREKKLEEERIRQGKRRKLKQQKIIELKNKLKTDFLNVDHFYNNECSDLITNEEYTDLKIAFIKSWAVKNSLIPEPDAQQAKAIGEYSGDILVKARAGSGKTRTIVNRAIFLLKHCKISPDEILILAFNRKAAKDIRDRFEKYKNEPPYIKNPPYILTFHRFAY
jgi:hypothetical protein